MCGQEQSHLLTTRRRGPWLSLNTLIHWYTDANNRLAAKRIDAMIAKARRESQVSAGIHQ